MRIVFLPGTADPGPVANPDRAGRVLTQVSVLHALWVRIGRPVFSGLLLARRLRLATNAISAARADLVVLAEDNVAGRSRLFAEAARRANIPVLVLPFTIPNPREAMLSAQPVGLFARWFIRHWPAWGRVEEGRQWIRLPLAQAMWMQWLGLAPARPWVLNSGPGTIVAESPALLERYRRLLGSDQPLAMIGAAVDARLRRIAEQREQRRRELGVGKNPLLVWSFPPDQISSGQAPNSPYRDYQTAAAALIAAVEKTLPAFDVLIGLHPRLSRDRVPLPADSRIRIVDIGMVDLLPLADLYLASSSATIRWALACGIPVVNIDIFRYSYDDFIAASGVVHVHDVATLADLLSRLARDPELQRITEQSKNEAPRWGMMDGGFDVRLTGLVRSLVASRRR